MIKLLMICLILIPISCQTLLIEIPEIKRIDIEYLKGVDDKEKIRSLIEGIMELESNRSYIIYQLKKADGRRIKTIE